jgi:hypothetical protein
MIYVDQIAELAAESIKAASLTPLRARESVPSSHCEAGPRENAIIGDDSLMAIPISGSDGTGNLPIADVDKWGRRIARRPVMAVAFAHGR